MTNPERLLVDFGGTLVPQFEAVFARHGGDWAAFYHAVGQIAELPPSERRDALARAGRTP